METVASISWDAALQGVISVAILLVALATILSRIRDQVAYYWALGWAALLACGAFFVAAESVTPEARFVAYLFDALVAPLMLMGALELSQRRPRFAWPVLVGVGAGLLRGGIDVMAMHAWDPVHSATLAPLFLLLAARATWSAPAGTEFRTPIAIGLMLFMGIDLFDAYQDRMGGQNEVMWSLLLIVSVPLATFQLASRLLHLGQDVDSAQQAEGRALQERDLERWRFEALFSHVRDLVAEIDEETRIHFVNDRVRDVLGLDPEFLVGRRGVDFVDAEAREAAARIFQENVAKGRFQSPVVVAVPHADGRIKHLEFTSSDYDFPGQTRLLIVARDVTDRIEAERTREAERSALERVVEERDEELRASLDRLREQERLAAVGTLASGIAHQINNPVGAISAAAEFALVAENDPDAEKIRDEAFRRIVEEAARAGRIVKSVLRFARHGTTQKWIDDLSGVVRRAAELSRSYVEERGGVLELEASAGALWVAMTPIEIEQMIVNLIHNAAESRVDGALVRVRTRDLPGEAIVEVVDAGRGMSAETRARAFDPFFTTRLRDGGSGLGLSVVHGIVTDHGGEIEIESEPDRGTCVRIRLPRTESGSVGSSDAPKLGV